MARTLGFLLQYLRPRPGAVEEAEVPYRRDGETLPATLYRPAGRRGPHPAWVVLHGLTYRGRYHPSLERLARALAASGALVFVPEIPEWRRLRVAPALTTATIRSAIVALNERADVAEGRIGVLGFSFGATQGLIAASDPELDGKVQGLAAWGGYCDLFNLFRFGIAGEYELDGVSRHSEPDPYGRWIMGANYVTRMPGHAGYTQLAAALEQLAREAGRRGVSAWDPVYDPLKARLRAGLPPAQRELFDIFAPPAGRPVPTLDRARELARELAAAALEADPLLDPAPFLPRVPLRTLLAHGRDDRLVPYTETLRLARAIPAQRRVGCTVTALFAHSGGAEAALGHLGRAREAARFLGLLRDILRLI
ncbi:MAG: hypothetical protein DIU52_009470 [bacterium]|jgi:pimeloyl-ACP methyl ester carboxylesterase|nr:MAG: hypothetical protein DIU52_08245 [bacterium]